MADKAAGGNRVISRNLATAAVGVAAAVVVTAWAARLHPFAGPGYAALTLFLFPLPVAIGLAAGFVSPRRAMLWAPIWAAIVTAIVLLLLAGSVQAARSLAPLVQLGVGALGVLLSAAAALAGEVSVQRVWTRKSLALLVAASAVTAAGGQAAVVHRGRAYERLVLPRTLLEVDSSYLAIPKGQRWRCARQPELGCYEISSAINGRRLQVYASPDGPGVLGMRLRIEGGRADIGEIRAARRYLMDLGFRKSLLFTLSQQRGAGGSLCAGLGLTRLTLEPDGTVRVEPFPQFEARKTSTRR